MEQGTENGEFASADSFGPCRGKRAEQGALIFIDISKR